MISKRIGSVTRGILIGLTMLFLLATPALALNDSAGSPMVLNAGQNSISDNLTGTPGGAYRYFQIAYQGGSAPVLVSLNFLPGYGTTGAQAFGFNIYGPNGISFAGQ